MKSRDQLNREDFSFLKDFDRIDEEKDWKIVQTRMKQGKHITLKPYWRVAASLVALLGLGYLLLQLTGREAEMQQLRAGEAIMEIVLPDGSLAVLNRGASISWPEKFNRVRREVILRGEAWFEVESDPRHPFSVRMDRAEIVVLGTRFNIKEDAGSRKTYLQVEEGKVAFSSTADPMEKLIVESGEAASVDYKGQLREISANRNLLAWRTGELVFEEDDLETVLATLGAYYEVELRLDPSISRKLEFTSTFRNEDLIQVLEELCLVLELSYEQHEEYIQISPQN